VKISHHSFTVLEKEPGESSQILTRTSADSAISRVERCDPVFAISDESAWTNYNSGLQTAYPNLFLGLILRLLILQRDAMSPTCHTLTSQRAQKPYEDCPSTGEMQRS